MRTNLWFCLVLAACTANADGLGKSNDTLPDDTGGTTDPGSLTIETFIEQLDTADCGHAFSCESQYPDDEDESFTDAYGSDAQSCVTRDPDYQNRSDYAQSVADGRIVFWTRTTPPLA